ncbi:MAG: hypothetical protein JST85_27920 [Acidobacteria bacterium]|nr:hypothetical protein [Acidobacteriota bacterium]
MTKKLIKLTLAVAAAAIVLGSAMTTKAYPPFLKKAAKFGAKDCLFCHKQPEGGEGWNDRGNWLIAEKDKRKADVVDVEWLADYKEADKKDGDKKEEEKKEEPKKEKP